MLKPEFIYKAQNFIFSDGSDKTQYFVVFLIEDEHILLISLTTSKSKLPQSYNNSTGCITFNNENGYGHSYIWESKQIIGRNGFNFPLRTYLQFEFKSQLIEINEDELLKSKITNKVEECDQLQEIEYHNLLNCVHKSRFLKNKYRKRIEEILTTNAMHKQ
ncbi:MAG: hypothetical protein EAZ27_00665 [Cytophagales bacterium]|nr:MAG: hypothetical protein EAZ27_00665 [Cytophagales bacterium]